ncbi:polysaccharide deacetylase family protein [Hymenobacter saemangeumensis]|uniref:Polysaccharide deacetylase family protein n=1 Tax=Hymenobacter saemangeumensis TaxID=1084522 RepID=A0ABP8IAG9_9BACT
MSKWLEAAVMTRPPRLLHALLPGCQWTGPAQPAGQPVLYLTFDDGPIPEETPWVLEQLALFKAQATFFCVGQNLQRYPELARAALAAGHRLGNHTQHHRSAWASARPAYLADVAACQEVLDELLPPAASFTHQALSTGHQKPLFRPPYGRLTWPLLRALQPHYRVVMWSVLTRDYDPDLRPEACLRLTLAAVRPGDVLVFHDSHKASARLRYVLPRVLAHFAGHGYQFAAL